MVENWSPGNGAGHNGVLSPPIAKVMVPRLSLPESNVPQASPRQPLSPRGAGPSSPNARPKHAPGSEQKGSPRFGETPRSDSARLSARRRTEDSVNAYIMRRQSCNSTNRRSSAGSCSKGSTRRPNPLLGGGPKAETPVRRRSPRDATPEHYPDTGGASCSRVQGSGSAHSTPVRGHGVHAKHRRTSSPSPVLLKDVMRAVASSLSSLGAGDAHPPVHEYHGDPEVTIAACSFSSCGGDAHHLADQFDHEEHEVIAGRSSLAAHLVHDIPLVPAAAVGSRGASAERRMSAESRYSCVSTLTESIFAVNPVATRRMSADSRCSADPAIVTQRWSQSERTAHSLDSPAQSQQRAHRDSSFSRGHKKTPSFKDIGALVDNGALRTARCISSPQYDESFRHLEKDQFDDDDELHAGNSTYARLEELTTKVQRLFVEVSASLEAPADVQAPSRPAVGPPSRPPRPPLAVMPMSVMPGYGCTIQATPVATPDGATSFSPHCELPEEEISRLKFRVHHLELNLHRHADSAPSDSTACSQEISELRKQLEETRGQLGVAKDEIQQARLQIHKLSQRMDGMQPTHSDSTTLMQTVTPRVIPANLPANTPPVPAPVTRSNNVPQLPLTARPQQRPPSPHPCAGHTLKSVSSSPLPTARMQRQGSVAAPAPGSYAPLPGTGSYAPLPGTGSYTPLPGSYAPPVRQHNLDPNGSYAPPMRACGSARASPLRAQPEIQSHSTACLVATPPHTARMMSSFVPPARGVPMKVGAMPARVASSPRLAG